MARIIKDRSPKPLEIGGETKWVCMCGLSKKKPLCDGSHKNTQDEEEGKIYSYNKDGIRAEL